MKRHASRTTLSCFAIAVVLLLLAAAPAIGDELSWQGSVDVAMERAQAKNQYILVDLYADWCGWCKVLEREVFTAPAFADFAADKVLLRVDVEDGGEGSRLQSRYEVRSLPTMLILDPHGVQVGSVQGYAPTDKYVRSLSTEVARYEASLTAYEALQNGKDLAAIRSLAETLHRRGDGQRAVTLYRRLVEVVPETSIDRARLELRIADALRIAGDLSRAKETADQARGLAKTLADPLLIEQLDLLGAQIAQDAGDCDRAARSLESFLREHPSSARRRDASQALWMIRKGHTTCS